MDLDILTMDVSDCEYDEMVNNNNNNNDNATTVAKTNYKDVVRFRTKTGTEQVYAQLPKEDLEAFNKKYMWHMKVDENGSTLQTYKTYLEENQQPQDLVRRIKIGSNEYFAVISFGFDTGCLTGFSMLIFQYKKGEDCMRLITKFVCDITFVDQLNNSDNYATGNEDCLDAFVQLLKNYDIKYFIYRAYNSNCPVYSTNLIPFNQYMLGKMLNLYDSWSYQNHKNVPPCPYNSKLGHCSECNCVRDAKEVFGATRPLPLSRLNSYDRYQHTYGNDSSARARKLHRMRENSNGQKSSVKRLKNILTRNHYKGNHHNKGSNWQHVKKQDADKIVQQINRLARSLR